MRVKAMTVRYVPNDRGISRLDYGTKYCPDSPSIEETLLQNAIVDCIKQVVQDESGYATIENLKQHVSMYFGKDDENSTAADEAKASELIQAITEAASTGQYTPEMQSMVEELNRIKAKITEKKSRQTEAQESWALRLHLICCRYSRCCRLAGRCFPRRRRIIAVM